MMIIQMAFHVDTFLGIWDLATGSNHPPEFLAHLMKTSRAGNLKFIPLHDSILFSLFPSHNYCKNPDFSI
jgi:hypothetical protein